MKDRRFVLNGNVATVLAQIACVDNSLPQGSPCSPIISNLIGHVLDVHLVKLASRNGCHYSRYADDLTFSTNLSQFPSAIAHTLSGNSDVWVTGSDLTKLMSKTSFVINQQKTRMQFKNSRQDVTGLIVNKKINVKSDYRRTVRAMVHSLLTHGSFERISSADDGKGGRTLIKIPGTTAELHGMLGFIDSVEHYNKVLAIPAGGIVSERRKSKDANPPRKELTGKELLYRRFLLYKEFFAMDKPVILCEGETDNVYLIHAIRSLAFRFPQLATFPKPGEIKIRPRIFKYVETSTGRILGLGGGTGDLANLIRTYYEELQRFVPPDSQHPFIIIIDNDKGAKGNGKPLHVIKNIAGIEIDRTAPFTHISGNLYLVLTPAQGELEDSAIEDLFLAETLSTKIDGKEFWWKKAAPPNDKYDSTKHYGKKVFAHKVVRPNADNIDFNGFSTLLTNITLAFEDFYRKHATAKSNK